MFIERHHPSLVLEAESEFRSHGRRSGAPKFPPFSFQRAILGRIGRGHRQEQKEVEPDETSYREVVRVLPLQLRTPFQVLSGLLPSLDEIETAIEQINDERPADGSRKTHHKRQISVVKKLFRPIVKPLRLSHAVLALKGETASNATDVIFFGGPTSNDPRLAKDDSADDIFKRLAETAIRKLNDEANSAAHSKSEIHFRRSAPQKTSYWKSQKDGKETKVTQVYDTVYYGSTESPPYLQLAALDPLDKTTQALFLCIEDMEQLFAEEKLPPSFTVDCRREPLLIDTLTNEKSSVQSTVDRRIKRHVETDGSEEDIKKWLLLHHAHFEAVAWVEVIQTLQKITHHHEWQTGTNYEDKWKQLKEKYKINADESDILLTDTLKGQIYTWDLNRTTNFLTDIADFVTDFVKSHGLPSDYQPEENPEDLLPQDGKQQLVAIKQAFCKSGFDLEQSGIVRDQLGKRVRAYLELSEAIASVSRERNIRFFERTGPQASFLIAQILSSEKMTTSDVNRLDPESDLIKLITGSAKAIFNVDREQNPDGWYEELKDNAKKYDQLYLESIRGTGQVKKEADETINFAEELFDEFILRTFYQWPDDRQVEESDRRMLDLDLVKANDFINALTKPLTGIADPELLSRVFRTASAGTHLRCVLLAQFLNEDLPSTIRWASIKQLLHIIAYHQMSQELSKSIGQGNAPFYDVYFRQMADLEEMGTTPAQFQLMRIGEDAFPVHEIDLEAIDDDFTRQFKKGRLDLTTFPVSVATAERPNKDLNMFWRKWYERGGEGGTAIDDVFAIVHILVTDRFVEYVKEIMPRLTENEIEVLTMQWSRLNIYRLIKSYLDHLDKNGYTYQIDKVREEGETARGIIKALGFTLPLHSGSGASNPEFRWSKFVLRIKDPRLPENECVQEFQLFDSAEQAAIKLLQSDVWYQILRLLISHGENRVSILHMLYGINQDFTALIKNIYEKLAKTRPG